VRIRLTLDVYREQKPEPVVNDLTATDTYDVSGATIERAPQFDHDTRPPIGFTTKWT